MDKNLKIHASFGHEIAACKFAKAFGVKILVAPKENEKNKYYSEAQKILTNMSFFYDKIEIVPFGQRETVYAIDFKELITSGGITAEQWDIFAKTKLVPSDVAGLPTFSTFGGTLFVPQKLISDEACCKTAKDQSLSPEVYNFLKGENLVLGQHFHKENDLKMVQKLAEEFDLYVPGLSENYELLGLRGIDHKKYYKLYRSLIASVGVAGTHTWILLSLFPQIPQLIVHPRGGSENWEAIAKAYRNNGYKIHYIGFDKETNLEALSQEIEAAYNALFS